MSDLVTQFNDVYIDTLKKVSELDIDAEDTTIAMKNLKILSESCPMTSELEAKPEPTTVLGKLKAGASWAWDNETTRVLFKAGGAFAGVALVTWTTIHRDHVIQREAMSLATQRNS